MASAIAKVDLTPLSITTRPAARLAQLLGGLVLYGGSLALMVRAGIGLAPWDVLHQGLATRLGWSFGAVTALTGVLVLAAWFPLRERPGIGTVLNVVIVAVSVDAGLAAVPPAESLPWQASMLVSGVVLNGLATASYVGARLGAGPRDGLMTGWHARTGWPLRRVRTIIELAVVIVGWFLGGTVGPGTVLYAVAIGPLTQVFLPRVAVSSRERG